LHSVLTFLIGPGATARDALLAIVDVAVVAFVCYHVLRFIRGTRATAILIGLFLLGLAYAGAEGAGLATLSWLLGHFLSYSFIFGVIVLFQADLRRALAELGRSSRLSRLAARLGQDDRAAQLGAIDGIVKAALELARRRVGALIVVERSADLSDVIGSGLRLDAAVTPELLVAIFQPPSPIHDGAAVVQGSRVAAAACLLPLSAAPAAPELGTRHRAAIGLAEEVDAAVVVVSEERGEVSVALDGALHRALDEKALRAILFGAFAGPERGGTGGFLARARARAASAPGGGGNRRAAL
jgi:diadenylate cyclase